MRIIKIGVYLFLVGLLIFFSGICAAEANSVKKQNESDDFSCRLFYTDRKPA